MTVDIVAPGLDGSGVACAAKDILENRLRQCGTAARNDPKVQCQLSDLGHALARVEEVEDVLAQAKIIDCCRGEQTDDFHGLACIRLVHDAGGYGDAQRNFEEPIFTGNAIEQFDEAYKQGLFYRIIGTNAVYHEELLKREWYISTNVSGLFANVITRIHHNQSLSDLLENRTLIEKLEKQAQDNLERELTACEQTLAETAKRLNVQESTVKMQLACAYKKLGAKGKTEAIRIAKTLGIL